jgi:hypothetical protein
MMQSAASRVFLETHSLLAARPVRPCAVLLRRFSGLRMATRPPLSSTKIDRSMRPLLAAHSIDRSAIFVAPARPFPFAAHQHVSTGLKDTGNAVGLQIGSVGNADLAFDDRDPIKRLPFLFICQFKVTEALTGQVEGAVNAPQVAFPLGFLSSFGNAGSIDDADQAAPAGLRSRRAQQLVNQKTQPVAASSQTIEQRWGRYIHQPHRRGPGRRQSQTAITNTVGKDQAQQVHRAFYHACLQKSASLPRTSLKRCRAPKPSYDIFPVSIQE